MEMWFSEFHTPDVKHSIRVNRQLYSKNGLQSDYQRIDIFETAHRNLAIWVLTLDGNVMLIRNVTIYYDEMITHVPMAVQEQGFWGLKTKKPYCLFL